MTILMAILRFLFFWQRPQNRYVISKGNHYSHFRRLRPSGNRIDFQVLIHQSWHYQNLNQWNKLIGFSQGLNHHKNSARVGWRCHDGQIRFCLYLYVNGQAIREPLQGDYRQGWVSGSLLYKDGIYTLKIGENTITHYSEQKNATHLLYPYFGGTTPAPHNVYVTFKHLRY